LLLPAFILGILAFTFFNFTRQDDPSPVTMVLWLILALSAVIAYVVKIARRG